jgi:hypothetical protein
MCTLGLHSVDKRSLRLIVVFHLKFALTVVRYFLLARRNTSIVATVAPSLLVAHLFLML